MAIGLPVIGWGNQSYSAPPFRSLPTVSVISSLWVMFSLHCCTLAIQLFLITLNLELWHGNENGLFHSTVCAELRMQAVTTTLGTELISPCPFMHQAFISHLFGCFCCGHLFLALGYLCEWAEKFRPVENSNISISFGPYISCSCIAAVTIFFASVQ